MLFALGSLWVNGIAVDWQAFHAHEKLRRIPLPTYPFQRKKLWIGPKIGTNWLDQGPGKVDDWFYRTNWKSAPLAAVSVTSGPWLVLGDAASGNLVAELRKQKADVIHVTAGKKFAALGAGAYAINPAVPGDYTQLFDQLIRHHQVPRHIAHLWGLNPSDANEDRCFTASGLHLLIKAWARSCPTNRWPSPPCRTAACRFIASRCCIPMAVSWPVRAASRHWNIPRCVAARSMLIRPTPRRWPR